MAIKLIDNRYKLDKVVYDSLYSSLYEVLELWDNDKRLYMILYNSEKQKHLIDYFINNFIDLSRIKHENLLLSYHFDIINTIDGKRVNIKQYYSTAEYIDSPTLDEIYMELNFTQRINILIQVANVLDFLHYKGIVYKHLSPSNIYVLEDRSIKLVDLATICEKHINSSYDDLTRSFLAPEILLNQEDLISENSDKYSFGMLMIYLLTENFNNPLRGEFNYIKNFNLNKEEENFLNKIINTLIKKSIDVREYKPRDIVDGLNEKFNINYKYDLIKERGVLNFQTKIVGRDDEINQILSLDDSLISGDIESKVVLLKGNTGTGKTRLLREVSYLLRLRGREVYNTEIGAGDNVDLKPMINILRQSIKSAPIGILDKYIVELSKVLPELGPIFHMENAPSISEDRERLRLFDRISNYLIEFSIEEPIYIIIDDLENCSLQFMYLIDYLINNMGKGRIILIISYNEKAIPEGSTKIEILSKWLNYEIVEEMLVSNLDLSEIGEFIQYILGISYKPLKFAAVMLRESQGNPKYIEYMMKNLFATGELYFSVEGYWGIKTKQYSDIYFPSTMDEALKSQIDLIKDEHMDIMKIVSVYYDAIPRNALQFMVDMDSDRLDSNLNELIAMRLLDTRVSDWGYSYSVNNIQLKKLIYYGIPEKERVAIHKEIARCLEKAYWEDHKLIMNEIVYHLISSNQRDRALEYVVRNARKERLYSSGSILLWEEAYEIDKELKSNYGLEILENLGNAYTIKGENEKALEIYKELFQNAMDLKSLEYAIRGNNGIADIYLKRNLTQLAIKKVKESIKLSKEIQSLELLIESKIIYNRILLEYGKFKEAKVNAEELLELSLKNDLPKNLGDIYNILGLIEYYAGDMDKALSRYEMSIEAFENVGDYINSTKPMNNIANIHMQYGRAKKAMEYYEKGLKIAENQGGAYLTLLFLNNIGSIHMELHEYDKALRYIDEARVLAMENEEANLEFLTYINLSLIYLLIGDYEQSYNYYSILHEKLESKNYSFEIIGFYHNFLGEFYFIFGRWEEALKYSKITMEGCKEFSLVEYMTSKARVTLIEYLKDNKYNKAEIEEIRCMFREVKLDIVRRESLLRLAFIPLLEGDYEYVRDILKEDSKLAKKHPIPKLDYIRKILLYAIENDEESIDNLIKLEVDMKKYNLPQIDLILNATLGKKFSEGKKYYEGINYLLETLDRMYRLIGSVPNRDYQIEFIKRYKADIIKDRLVDMMYNALNIELDCIYIDQLGPKDRIEKYFDGTQIISYIEDKDFIKITETSNFIDTETKSVDSLDALVSRITPNYEKNLELILKYLAKETFAQKAYILMYDEEINKYVPLTSLDGDYDWVPNESLLSLSNRYSDGILINNNFKDNVIDLYREFLPKGTRALICVPIGHTMSTGYIGKDRRKSSYYDNPRNEGYIYLETERVFNRFDEARHKLTCSLIQLIYINIENYRLKILSTIDKLTGTSTRKYLEQEYKRMFDDARKNGSSFAVLMIDIDDFKKVNDTYGHRKGDEVLSEIGKCLKNTVRGTDLVARYGGEEFIIILKDIDEKSAKKTGEKIRKNIEKVQISKIEDPITISVGVAMFPKHSQFKEELIEKADQALYHAKESGKNKTVVWNGNLFNTLHRADRLAGILSGNMNQDQRNILAILDIIDLTKSNMTKEEKIFEFLGRLLETIDAESCTLIELDKNKKTKKIYSRTRMQQEWGEIPFIDMNIVQKAIDTKKGEFLIDWENIENVDIVLNTPNWQSIIVFPMEFRGEVQGIIYITVALREKEFDYNSYNMVKVLGGVFQL